MSYTVLSINASSNPASSTSRQFNLEAQQRLAKLHPEINVIERDVSQGLPLINADWIAASYTAPAERSDKQQQQLALSDELIGELKAADEIIIATPMYNFSVPAGLKAWIDLVARVGETFQYTEQGPQGLLANKPVTLIISTGGVPVESAMDFATAYLKQVLGFIGISDVSVVSAEGMNASPEASLEKANEQLEQLFQLRAQAA